ncbi:hypothetical protein L248_0378 [Schleiferilactobacillus shenzhenensis LY-73]|uniref:Uncharacterized protein n=1 Tax=Schleiferilactobacillus shenzhenensis LY-73 TaxID=1231336 RepID=U4TR47_9LACO|nr:hypothetical protein L248_0378 [Schleiferilactobacillus shenzhenensis LY-73]
MIPSSERAILLSVDSMFFSFTMILLFPAQGWLVQIGGVQCRICQYRWSPCSCTAGTQVQKGDLMLSQPVFRRLLFYVTIWACI